MEAYDLAHKLAYAGSHSPVPFFTGPEYTNAVPAVPVLSMLRIFIEPEHWSEENLKVVSREIARVLGPTSQFDVGMARVGRTQYGLDRPATGSTARLIKLNPDDPQVVLRLRDGTGDRAFRARFPRLQFEPMGEDFWRSLYAPGAVKEAGVP